MQVRLLMIPVLLALLALSACAETPQLAGPRGEKGEQGPPGPAGPAGPAGPGGTAIRFVHGVCRQACTVARPGNERSRSTHGGNPGGTFVWADEGRSSSRVSGQSVAVKVVVACAPK